MDISSSLVAHEHLFRIWRTDSSLRVGDWNKWPLRSFSIILRSITWTRIAQKGRLVWGWRQRIWDLSPLASLPHQLKVLKNSKRLHTPLQVSHVTWPALGKEALWLITVGLENSSCLRNVVASFLKLFSFVARYLRKLMDPRASEINYKVTTKLLGVLLAFPWG